MPKGYAGKYLDVDLTRETMVDITFDWETLEAYFGGRGLAAKILLDRIGMKWPQVNPLGPENILTIMTGPMTGFYPGGRVCVSGKSPLSNGTVGSTTSSEFAHELKTAGYDGIIVTGKASSPVYILVTDEGGEIRDANHIRGMHGWETIKTLNREVTEQLNSRKPIGLWKDAGMLYIGPAGENMVRNSAVMSKLTHAAGYGGYGSVMGSKNLKAIVAKGRGPLPEVHDLDVMKELWKKAHSLLIARDSWRRTGTGYGGWSTAATLSSSPVRNWQEEWHDERSFVGPRFETRYWVKKYWADFNCTANCMKLSCVKSGKWKGDITDGPDYEQQAFAGNNFGIFDPGDCIHLSALIDELGHSAIGGSSTMAFAAELYQRGVLTEKDIGFKLEWGDVEAFDKLANNMAFRQGIGDILAEGTYRAAMKIGEMKGVDLSPYAVHVKGIEIGAHGTRSAHDFLAHDLSYATNVQGGDHTSTAYDGYQEHSGSVFSDSGVYCNFCRTSQDLAFEIARAVTGFPITVEGWRRVNGPRIVTLQRAFLMMGGPDVFWEPIRDDENPPRFYEPLPSGPFKGSTTDRDLVAQKRSVYFEIMGWDERGIPKRETLERLGLADLEPSMERLRY